MLSMSYYYQNINNDNNNGGWEILTPNWMLINFSTDLGEKQAESFLYLNSNNTGTVS